MKTKKFIITTLSIISFCAIFSVAYADLLEKMPEVAETSPGMENSENPFEEEVPENIETDLTKTMEENEVLHESAPEADTFIAEEIPALTTEETPTEEIPTLYTEEKKETKKDSTNNEDVGKISDTRYAGILGKSDIKNDEAYNSYNLDVGNSTITISTVRDLSAYLGKNMTIDIEGDIENFILKNIYPSSGEKILLASSITSDIVESHPANALAQTGPEMSFVIIALLTVCFVVIRRKKRIESV